MGRRGNDVVGLRTIQRPVVGRIGPRRDRLRAECLARPSLVGLGSQNADEILLEAQLVDDREALAVSDHLERRRVLAPVHLDRGVARQAKARRPPPVDLDALTVRDRSDGIGAPRATRARGAAELAHLDVEASELRDARVLHDRDADRIGRAHRRSRERHHGRRREQAAHRRPTTYSSSVRTTLSRSDVASGK